MDRVSLHDYFISNIRTQSPILAGLILAWVSTKLELIIDEGTGAAWVSLFTALVSGLYYAVVRYVETRVPAAGWLLGRPAAPTYPDEVEV